MHGDYRLDNMLFGQPGADRPLTVVDWQTVTWGPAMTDVAYFLGCALADDVRREQLRRSARRVPRRPGPDAALSLDDVREGVRRQSLLRGDDGDRLVDARRAHRTGRRDVHDDVASGTASMCSTPMRSPRCPILPPPEPLAPSADDEGAHPPGAEPLWSESWYSDFVDESQAIGGWFRLGVMPNEKIAWINALLCGPDIPTVAVNDFQVALPADPSAVKTDAIELTHAATEPLQTYRVRCAAAVRLSTTRRRCCAGRRGDRSRSSMDLVWTTAGTPYLYRLTPRYEIPCTVSGTVSFDTSTIEVAGVAGQRDHSWGVRDWWSMDWVWSALHLHDGTHLHGVDLRIPGVPPMGVGYIQPPAAPLIELQGVTARETFGDNGLPATTDA